MVARKGIEKDSEEEREVHEGRKKGEKDGVGKGF